MSESQRPSVRPRSLTAVAEVLGIAPAWEWAAINVSGITLDSASVRRGDIFVGRPGQLRHGAEFAALAVASGAVVIVTDLAGSALLGKVPSDVPVLVIEDIAGRVGDLAAWVYGEPARSLSTVGVTGTNGKTTTTWLIESGWRQSGAGVGIIGTLGVHLCRPSTVDRIELPSARTTPEATDLHALLAVMCESGISSVAMEVSSHALALGRVNGLVFDLAVFTNLTQDHLDFHRDIADYFAAKSKLFTPERARRGLVNIGDQWGRKLLATARIPITTFDVEGPADWTARDLVSSPDGTTTFSVLGPGVQVAVRLGLPGRFQVANALAAIAALVEIGVDANVAAAGVSACLGVPGRMERVDIGQPFLSVVDYAHTPEAVSRALSAVREIVPGRLLVVLGCGGDRDRAKRSLMGARATVPGALVVVTDDNPRSEDPASIRAAVLDGARSLASECGAEVVEIPDRAEAIKRVVATARPGDAVIILGKGAETGQEIAGTLLPFDDRVELRRTLQARGSA